MTDVPNITQDELIRRIRAKLEATPHQPDYSDFHLAPPPTEPAAYLLVLGAGFSYGVVPLVDQLMRETIGDYYYPDQDQSSQERGPIVNRRDSASFWAEVNEAAENRKIPTVEVDAEGLPKDPGAAYQYLFTYEGAEVLFAPAAPKPIKKLSLLQKLSAERARALRERGQAPTEQRAQPQNTGEIFVKGFLRYVLDLGVQRGWGSTGRHALNPAHVYLAALLEAQQLGRGWKTCAFCRTILTTNFDTLLQNALQMVNLLYRLTDRPEHGLDASDLCAEEGPIHLTYLHGSILRHNPASTIEELAGLENKNVEVLHSYLENRDIIVIGYGGWNDGLMTALRRCHSSRHTLYWCNIGPQPPEHVARLLTNRAGDTAYVDLGQAGADRFMRLLYEALIPAAARRDPMQRYRDWAGLVWNRQG